jgi:hypothetical protein
LLCRPASLSVKFMRVASARPASHINGVERDVGLADRIAGAEPPACEQEDRLASS